MLEIDDIVKVIKEQVYYSQSVNQIGRIGIVDGISTKPELYHVSFEEGVLDNAWYTFLLPDEIEVIIPSQHKYIKQK
jgi:hypothetical protein